VKFGSLQVRTPDGSAQDFPIDLPSIVIGRAEGNGIVIDDLSISRRHARLVVESGRLLVEDLGSAAGTFVDGHRIDPGAPNLIELDQPLRFGDVTASYVPAPPTVVEPDSTAEADSDREPVEQAPSAAIRITVTSPSTPVEPGGAVFATAVIHNRGRVVDLVTLGVTGVPAAWVTFSQATLALVPGTRETVTLVFQPPITSASLAGEYDFGVTVNSAENEREGIAFGKLQVTAFEATEMHLLPIRSRRDFVLTAKNNGNAFATYALSGKDEEGIFAFDFDAPSIELQPGQERKVPMRARRRKRQWFGRTVAAPFQLEATPISGAAIAVEAPGQLLIQPPLERWKWPVLLTLLIGLLALAFWLSWVYRDQIPTWIPWSTKGDAAATTGTGAEAAYAGVHMCEKSQDERDQAAAKVTPPAAGTTGAPLFAQNNPTWAKVEYAKAADPEFGPDWCGTTIEQCGCAMTSVTTIMALFNILTMPDGSQLTPQTVNAWFNDQARKTARGWVSRGYIYGDVVWTAANELSGAIAKQKPGSPTIRFAGFGPGTDDDIKAELKAGRPVVLEVPGHYIAAVGLDGDKIMINDPYYADRRTLDVYKGKVKGSVHFESSNDLSAVVITVPKDLRVRVLDKAGNVVGSLNADEAGSPAPVGIQGAYLSSRDAWRDPTCVESPPPAGAGTTSIFLPGKKEDYRIEVINPSNGGTSIAIHSYDQDGNESLQTQDATGASVVALSYDPAQATPTVQVLQGVAPGSGGTTTPGGTPTLPSAGGGGAGNGGAVANPTTPGASPTVAPSATATRTVAPAPTPVPPSAVTIACDIAYTGPPNSAGVTCTGNVTGTFTSTRWSMNGLPAPVPPGSTSFTTTFSQDTTASVEMTACNITMCKTGSFPLVVKFSSPTPTPSATPLPGTPTPTPTVASVGPPPAVNIVCNWAPISTGYQVDCSTSFVEAYNVITWRTTGASPAEFATGAKHFTAFTPTTGVVTVQAEVCLGSTCTLSNLATVTLGQFVTQLHPTYYLQESPSTSGELCQVPHANLLPFNEWVIVTDVPNATPDRPTPTGTITYVFNGNILGVVSLDQGEASIHFTPTFGGSNLPISIQYSGDANWTANSVSCQIDAG
jgi:hypothetical protein